MWRMTLSRKELAMETVRACLPEHDLSQSISLSYTNTQLIGQGAFGVVNQARLSHNGQVTLELQPLGSTRDK